MKVKSFVLENTWLPNMKKGWGNGYACIPPGHPLHGKDYDTVHDLMPDLEVHGGLTFSSSANEVKEWKPKGLKNYWIVGFDTCHYMDNAHNCNKHFVEKETESLRQQIENYKEIVKL